MFHNMDRRGGRSTMKGMKKGVLGFIVFSMMVIGLFIPNKVYASEPSDFVIENGVLIKYRGSGGHVVIPDEITKIGDKAFEDCHKLTSVIIPDSVTEIGNSAFNNCSKLIRITIPNSVTEITFDAFWGTPWLGKKRSEHADHLVIINNILIDGNEAQGKIIAKGNTKKLSISLPPNLKRVNKFTTKKGEVKISILYNKTLKDVKYLYNIEKVLNDTIKATEKGTDYAYTTVTLPNGDKKVFTTKVTVK